MPHQKSKPIESFEREWLAWHEKSVATREPPKGAISAKEYATRIAKPPCSPQAATFVLNTRVQRGELDTGLFRVRRGCRSYELRFWWRKKT